MTSSPRLPGLAAARGADTHCSSDSSRSLTSLGHFTGARRSRAEPADLLAKLQRALVKTKLSRAKPPLLSTACPTNSKPTGCWLHLARGHGLILILFKCSACKRGVEMWLHCCFRASGQEAAWLAHIRCQQHAGHLLC